jgi:hypothetical protein
LVPRAGVKRASVSAAETGPGGALIPPAAGRFLGDANAAEALAGTAARFGAGDASPAASCDDRARAAGRDPLARGLGSAGGGELGDGELGDGASTGIIGEVESADTTSRGAAIGVPGVGCWALRPISVGSRRGFRGLSTGRPPPCS